MDDHADEHMDERTNDELERYLDGCLSEPEQTAFEERLAEDPALAAQVELQHALDASLRNVFQPVAPEIGAALERALAAGAVPNSTRATPRGAARRRFRLPAAIAAGLLAAVFGWAGWSAWRADPGATSGPGPNAACVQVRAEWLTIYERNHAAGQACSTLFWRATVHGLPLQVEDPGVLIDGPIQDDRLPVGVTVFRARVGTDLALVFICERELDPGPIVGPLPRAASGPDSEVTGNVSGDGTDDAAGDAGGTLHLHRRVLGHLVLYELSPFAVPGVLPLVTRQR